MLKKKLQLERTFVSQKELSFQILQLHFQIFKSKFEAFPPPTLHLRDHTPGPIMWQVLKLKRAGTTRIKKQVSDLNYIFKEKE